MDTRNVVDSQQRIDRGFALAAVIQAIPSIIWIALVTIFSGFLLAALFFNHAHIESFVDQVLLWADRLLIVAGIVLLVVGLYKCYKLYHTIHLDIYERRNARAVSERQQLLVEKQRLQNRQLENLNKITENYDDLIRYAIAAGRNVKISLKGEIEVTSYLSNIHTLGTVPTNNAQNLLNGPQSAPLIKPTVDEMVKLLKPNSYELCLGKSLQGSPLLISLPGCHIKVIGASQMGKSCLIGSLLEEARQSHDKQHLLLAILDLEDMTGRLFEGDEHILTIRSNGQATRMHAHSPEEVAEHIILLHRVMVYRYEQAREHGFEYIEAQPRILIYMEEFIYWKRMLSSFVDEKTREEAIGAVTGIATRGLKVGMHLLIAAQVNYEDKDLKDAFAQFIGVSVSFAVKPSAARAAGFVSTELLNENYAAKQRGQYVVEMIGGAEIGVSPDYDVRTLVKQLPSGKTESRKPTPLDMVPDLLEEQEKDTGELEGTNEPLPLPIARLWAQNKRAEDVDLGKAIEYWNESQPSVRDLETRYELTNHQARRLRGFILSQASEATGGEDVR